MEHLLITEEVAEFLRVEVITIRRLVNRGELSAYRIGGEYRFTESDLEEYLKQQRVSSSTTLKGHPDVDPLFGYIYEVLQRKPMSLADTIKDHFTENACRALRLSQEAAQRLQHNYIGTEHFLLGLIDQGEGVAVQALHKLEGEPERMREMVHSIITRNDRIVAGHLGLTPAAKKVIEEAVDEARHFNHRYIGTEHLLVGLLREGTGIAAGVLDKVGVTLEKARLEIQQILSQHQEREEKTSASPVPPEQPLS